PKFFSSKYFDRISSPFKTLKKGGQRDEKEIIKKRATLFYGAARRGGDNCSSFFTRVVFVVFGPDSGLRNNGNLSSCNGTPNYELRRDVAKHNREYFSVTILGSFPVTQLVKSDVIRISTVWCFILVLPNDIAVAGVVFRLRIRRRCCKSIVLVGRGARVDSPKERKCSVRSFRLLISAQIVLFSVVVALKMEGGGSREWRTTTAYEFGKKTKIRSKPNEIRRVLRQVCADEGSERE
ncbi:hypothetical protein U1Q18_051532, partial [Sarracenia purpurea var. burkii]